MDSSKFDLRLMNSGAINLKAPEDLAQTLAPHLSDMIMSAPDEGHLEVLLRSLVDILVISKLQAEYDRSELDEAKKIIMTGDSSQFQYSRYGDCQLMNVGHWSVIHLFNRRSQHFSYLCDNISEALDHNTRSAHFIFDLSQVQRIDLELTAYFLGAQGMLSNTRKNMSLAWLPKYAVSDISKKAYDSLISKFSLFKKGAFLLSTSSQRPLTSH